MARLLEELQALAAGELAEFLGQPDAVAGVAVSMYLVELADAETALGAVEEAERVVEIGGDGPVGIVVAAARDGGRVRPQSEGIIGVGCRESRSGWRDGPGDGRRAAAVQRVSVCESWQSGRRGDAGGASRGEGMWLGEVGAGRNHGKNEGRRPAA